MAKRKHFGIPSGDTQIFLWGNHRLRRLERSCTVAQMDSQDYSFPIILLCFQRTTNYTPPNLRRECSTGNVFAMRRTYRSQTALRNFENVSKFVIARNERPVFLSFATLSVKVSTVVLKEASCWSGHPCYPCPVQCYTNTNGCALFFEKIRTWLKTP